MRIGMKKADVFKNKESMHITHTANQQEDENYFSEKHLSIKELFLSHLNCQLIFNSLSPSNVWN